MKFKLFTLITLAILTVQLSYADNGWKSYEKEISKSFKVGSAPNLGIENKFGDIRIMEGNEGEISFDIRIEVSARDKDVAEEMLEEINVRFAELPNGVNAVTKIGEVSKIGKGWFERIFGNTNTNYSIEYVVKVPKSTSVELLLEHGDIESAVDFVKGDIDIQFGDFTAMNFSEELVLSIAHGDAEVENLQDALVDVSFGEFECASGNEIRIDSKHSGLKIIKAKYAYIETSFGDCNLGTVDKVEFDGGHGDFRVNSVETIIAENAFGDIDLNQVTNSFDIRIEHGDFNATIPKSDFVKGKAKVQFGDADITSSRSLDVHIEGSFMSAYLPSKFDTQNRFEDDNSLEVKGKYTVDGTNYGSIYIDLEHGSINID